MAEAVFGSPKEPERVILMPIEEWIKLMNRTFEVISKQLEQLEKIAGRYNSMQNGSVFSANDARALSALSNTIKTVRVTTNEVEQRHLSEADQRALAESRAKQDELERRLARLAEHGEDK